MVPSTEMPSSLKKSNEGAESFNADDVNGAKKEMSQKEITLQEELDVRDRVDMYRNYLIYCMSGDVMQMPMGGTVVLERDASEFGRLSQLGDVLGLTQLDVMKVHTDMAEEAYRNQVKNLIILHCSAYELKVTSKRIQRELVQELKCSMHHISHRSTFEYGNYNR